MNLRRVLLLAAALMPCLPGNLFAQSKLTIKGSDTLGAKLIPMMAEAFKAKRPEVTFEIAAEGSTTGITAITDGTADIGMSSRPAEAREVSFALTKGVEMKATNVCYDAIAIIVNAENPIEELAVRQVEGIFAGDVTDWSSVGGDPGPISVYTRNTASGTYRDFKNLAMNRREYAPAAQKMAGTEQIAAEVAGNRNGIGYVGLAYTKTPGTKVVSIFTRDGKSVTPGVRSVNRGDYPYARPNFLYTNGAPTGLVSEFIAFALGPEGQKIVEEVGFVPVSEAHH